MRWSDIGMSGWGWLAMGLFWLALILVVVVVVAHLLPAVPRVTRSTRSASSVTGDGSALDALDRRLAQGEIDTATYLQARAEIMQWDRHT